MGYLKARYKSLVDYGGFSEDYNVNPFITTEVPIECLVPTVGHNDNLVEKLLKDIEDNGLVNPLVTHKYIKNYREIYPRHLTGSSYWGRVFNNIEDSKESQLIVMFGNCRMEAAKRMGYTSIDCIVLSNFNVNKAKNLGRMLAAYKGVENE
jgi:hypothetical protein